MMSSNTWFYSALAAALLWGICYVLSERVMNQGITPAFLLLISGILVLPFYYFFAHGSATIQQGLEIMLTNKSILFMVVAASLSTVLANYLVLYSVSEKNATLATLVEIAYPVFTFMFAWLLFKDVQLTWNTAMGGILIFSGIALIYLKG